MIVSIMRKNADNVKRLLVEHGREDLLRRVRVRKSLTPARPRRTLERGPEDERLIRLPRPFLLIGVGLRRLPAFPRESAAVLNNYVIYVPLPALVLLRIPGLPSRRSC